MSRFQVQKAIAHHRAGRVAEAETIYRAVLQRDPQNADALHLLGIIGWERDRTDYQAKQMVEAALALRPDSPFINHNYAAILSNLGRNDEARRHYRRAVKLKKDYAEAYFNLATVHKFSSGDREIRAMMKLSTSRRLTDADRCFIGFALGKALADIGEYDLAFRWYAKGNAKRPAQFDPSAWSAKIDHLIAITPRVFFQDRASWGIDSEQPIFVVGMPRSGTTLTEQIISAHSDVTGGDERLDMTLINRTMSARLTTGDGDEPDATHNDLFAHLPRIPEDMMRGFATTYLANTAKALEPGTSRLVDKLPTNFTNIALIACMFPKARIIHVTRDPVDTCLSCYFQKFTRGHDYAFRLDWLADYFRSYRKLMAHWHEVLPGRIHDVSYEQLVSTPRETIADLLYACGLDSEPACFAPHRNDRAVATASRWQVRQPIYRSSVERWRRYKAHIGPLLELREPEPIAAKKNTIITGHISRDQAV